MSLKGLRRSKKGIMEKVGVKKERKENEQKLISRWGPSHYFSQHYSQSLTKNRGFFLLHISLKLFVGVLFVFMAQISV